MEFRNKKELVVIVIANITRRNIDLEDLVFGRLGVDIWADIKEDVDNSLETWSIDLVLIIISLFSSSLI